MSCCRRPRPLGGCWRGPGGGIRLRHRTCLFRRIVWFYIRIGLFRLVGTNKCVCKIVSVVKGT